MEAKRVYIAGSSRGFGLCLAKAFIAKDYFVIMNGRSNINPIDGVPYHCCNIFDVTLDDFKLYYPDIVINNAFDRSRAFESGIAQIKFLNTCSIYFQDKKHGTIININSTAALYPNITEPSYCASKAGLKAYSECYKLTLKRQGIKVIDVYPEGMNIGMNEHKDKEGFIDSEELSEFILGMVKMKSFYISSIVLFNSLV
jgi:short-subunit dehydrogenase